MAEAAVPRPSEIGGHLIRCETEQAWHEARLRGISGSDASKIALANKYGSVYELWCEKTGRIVYADAAEDETIDQNEAAYWGVILEPVIRDEFIRRTGHPVHIDPKYSLRQHSSHSWMIGTPDGYVYLPDRGWGIWECKTAGAHMRDKWKDTVPASYLMQVMHYMAITDLRFAIFSALIGGQMYKQVVIERDDSFIELMIEAEQSFYACVKEDRVPMIDGHPATGRALATVYPSDNGDMVELPEAAIAWDEERMKAIADQDDASERRDRAENLIKQGIGNASYGILPNGVRYSWKGSSNRRLLRLKAAG